MQLRVVAAVACLLVVCSLAAARGRATGIYWAEGPTGLAREHGTIARAEIDGSRVAHLVGGTTGGAGIAVDGRYVYWANYGAGTIGRARLDGSRVKQRFIGRASFPVGLAVGGGHIYWTEYDSIGRANLDGSHVEHDFIDTENPVGLAVGSRHIYWTSKRRDRIGRATLDGTQIEERFVTGANRPVGVATDGRYVYWANGGDDTIGRANLDGSRPNQRCIAVSKVPLGNVVEGVATDGRYVYWTNYPANSIGRARPDGTSASARFIQIKGVPEGIAVVGKPARPPSRKCVPSRPRVLLGERGFIREGYPAGWGESAPATISNGGAARSGTISGIHWSTWGKSVAVGRGWNPIYTPHGGYYPRPVVVQLRATLLRRCRPGARLVYTRLLYREPSRPGGPVGKWTIWASNICG